MTEKVWHVDFGGEAIKSSNQNQRNVEGPSLSSGVAPPPIYTKQPRFCSLPTLYRTPIECNIRYAFSLLITVHSNIEMKEQSSQLGYSWHVFVCMSIWSVCRSVYVVGLPPQLPAPARSVGRVPPPVVPLPPQPAVPAPKAPRETPQTTSSWVMVSVPCFFLASEEGNKKTAAVWYFLFGIYKLSCEHLFFWKGSWKMTQKPELDVLTFF